MANRKKQQKKGVIILSLDPNGLIQNEIESITDVPRKDARLIIDYLRGKNRVVAVISDEEARASKVLNPPPLY